MHARWSVRDRTAALGGFAHASRRETLQLGALIHPKTLKVRARNTVLMA
jgi:hypothetical protein